MPYLSVDALQAMLTKDVFHYAKDSKKAAGRALGTLVEVITFYLLHSWGLRDSLAIEKPLAEFANPDITHNVEYSLHPVLQKWDLDFSVKRLPINSVKIRAELWHKEKRQKGRDVERVLYATNDIVRNCCTIWENEMGLYVAHLENREDLSCKIVVNYLHNHPYAVFECKRVGIEEGMKKGPQTIEKAKQGAYVARTVSALQKIRFQNGQMGGVLEKQDGSLEHGLYADLLREAVASSDLDVLQGFILTVGVASNHGNWFTADKQNKEMRVLAQSYDWLLFLTDEGLSSFVHELLLEPVPELQAAKNAFLASYKGDKSGNRFTKITMDVEADAVLKDYFKNHQAQIAAWFNVIAPSGRSLDLLREELEILRDKDWESVYKA